MKILKRFLAPLLALAMLFAFSPASVLAASAASGTCGANVTWQYSGGTLTVSGTGDMTGYWDDYNKDPAPWHDAYSESIEIVIIENGVTSIGNSAFQDCVNLKSVTIPDSVTSIGEDAFYRCESLTSVVIPDSVTIIKPRAFEYCKALTYLTIPSTLTSIEVNVFCGCNALTSVTIPDRVVSIGNCAFYDCESLTSVTIPKSVTSIGDWAFNDCYELADVYYGGSEEDWNNIEYGNEPFTWVRWRWATDSATIHFNSSAPADTETISVTLNGSKIAFDQQPVIIDGRTMVPLRAIFEALGASVAWDNSTQTVVAIKDGKIVQMTIGDTTMYVNGAALTLDVAPQLVNSRTLVPARAVAEAFDCSVSWNDTTKTVVITN